MSAKREIMTFIIGALLIYLAATAAMYFGQRSFIYFPDPNRQNRATYQAGDMDVIHAKTSDGLTLEGWYKAPQGDKPVIVVFHGNASHMGMSAWKVQPYLEAGYGALLPAYRGYAGNPGKPTEAGLYNDARAFLHWLETDKGIPENRIVLLGESLGTGVAVEMAATDFPSIRGLILESPYTSFGDLASTHYPFIPFAGSLVRDRYDSIRKIKKVKAPLLVVHGRQDVVVPFALGERLYRAANEPKQMAVIPLAGHNDLYSYGAGERILHFLSTL